MLSPAVTVLLLLGQTGFEPAAELTTEAGAGESPLVAGQDPAMTVSAVVQPGAVLYAGGGTLVGSLRYNPRITWRRPNVTKTARPLLLHNGDLRLRFRPSDTWVFGTDGALSFGEPDYSTLTQLLGNTTSSSPPIQKVLVASASASVTRVFGPLTSGGLRGEFSHRRALEGGGDQDMPAPMAMNPAASLLLAKQYSYSLGPYVAQRFSPRDEGEVALDFSYDTREPETNFLMFFASAAWTHLLTRGQSVRLEGGVAYIKVARPAVDDMGRPVLSPTGEPQRARENLLSPLASVSLQGLLTKIGGMKLRSSLQLAIESVVDPVLSTAGPRGSTGGSLTLEMSRAWQAAAEARFSTALRGDPKPPGVVPPPMMMMGMATAAIPPDETTVSAQLGLRHTLSPFVSLAALARWSERGPHVKSDDFEWHQREIWMSLFAIITTKAVSAL